MFLRIFIFKYIFSETKYKHNSTFWISILIHGYFEVIRKTSLHSSRQRYHETGHSLKSYCFYIKNSLHIVQEFGVCLPPE
jgi:5-bromo-4-chloroindolyl phosphate hydrolysis protein